MTRLLHTVFVCGLFLASAAQSAEQTAAQWADAQQTALAAITDASLAETVKTGAPAFDALFAQIKTGGASDALASVRIAALSQYVMRPGRDAARSAYADALLAAAQRATDGDVVCFFLNQLRWCGLPRQAAALRAFEKSSAPGVAEIAAMAVQAATDDRTPKAAPVQPTRAAALNQTFDALKPAELTPRLLQTFDDPDAVAAGVALARARTTGGSRETALWAAKLKETASPVRRIMLLDMLAARGDRSAAPAVAEFTADAEDDVAVAAQHALLVLDADAFAHQLPALFKVIHPQRFILLRDNVRQLKTPRIKAAALIAPYDQFCDLGKRLSLELFRERHIAEALPLSLRSLDARDGETVVGAFRYLRELAGPAEAETLADRLLIVDDRVAPEAQIAFAFAARRNGEVYTKSLLKAIAAASPAQKSVVLGTAARIGGEPLLKTVEREATAENAETAAAAVRALSLWIDDAAIPTLLHIAATSANAKLQTLALRGLDKRFENDDAARAKAFLLWKAFRDTVPDGASKKAVGDLFIREVNVALGKPVTTDVPTEGANVPANLTDGTPDRAWYGNRSPAHAQIDLGAVYALHAAHVTFYHDGRTYTFTLELSEDGQAWKPIAGNTDAPKPATAEGLRINFQPTPARYARLTVVKNSANQAVHVLELKLFSFDTP